MIEAPTNSADIIAPVALRTLCFRLFFDKHRSTKDELNIRSSYLTCFSGTEFGIEPSIYWHDELGEFRLSLIEEEFAEKWAKIPADEEKRAVALKLREGLRDLYDENGKRPTQRYAARG